MTIILTLVGIWLVYEWCHSFRDLLGERGWMSESQRSQEQKQRVAIIQAQKMMY